jgi:hypothetical protein
MFIPTWVIIALLIIISYILYMKAIRGKQTVSREVAFRPYWLRIFPKWKIILKDFRLSENTLEYIVGTYSKGISFTALHSGLIYRNDTQTFHTSVNFSEKFYKIDLPYDKPDDSKSFHPIIWITNGKEGYEIHLTDFTHVRRNWLMPNTTRETAKIALIPYSALNYESSENMDQKLKECGWNPVIDDLPEDAIIYENEPILAISQYESAQFSFFIDFI